MDDRANKGLAAIRTLVEPVVVREGFELVDLELLSEHGHRILRLTIDTIPPGTKERAVSVDDCSTISRVVGDLLDVEDVVPGAYHLEVSSPGVYRPLTKPEHFLRAIGERVRVRTVDKVDDRRVFVGRLVACDATQVTINVDGQSHTIEMDKVKKANLDPELS